MDSKKLPGKKKHKRDLQTSSFTLIPADWMTVRNPCSGLWGDREARRSARSQTESGIFSLRINSSLITGGAAGWRAGQVTETDTDSSPTCQSNVFPDSQSEEGNSGGELHCCLKGAAQLKLQSSRESQKNVADLQIELYLQLGKCKMWLPDMHHLIGSRNLEQSPGWVTGTACSKRTDRAWSQRKFLLTLTKNMFLSLCHVPFICWRRERFSILSSTLSLTRGSTSRILWHCS